MNQELLKKCAIPFQCDDWEWNELQKQFFIENHQVGWSYCDVGSCRGFFTNLFKNFNPKVIYAFDINYNNPVIEDCIFERKAISNKNGIVNVYNAGTHQSHIFDNKNNDFSHEIESITLDTYFMNKDIDCLKIDIEGAELMAIKGGIETIKKCSLVLIECHDSEMWNEMLDIFKQNNLVFRSLITNEIVTKSEMPYQIYKKD